MSTIENKFVNTIKSRSVNTRHPLQTSEKVKRNTCSFMNIRIHPTFVELTKMYSNETSCNKHRLR